MQAPMSVWRSCKMTHICRWQTPSWFFKLICRGPLCLLWLPARIIWVQNLSVWRVFDCSALIDVKRNFEQTNPFECFFTLLGFALIENRSKNCPPVMSNTVALLRTVKSSWRIVRSVQTISVANGPYSEHIRSVHLIMTSEHSVLRFVRSVRSARIVTVRMLRAVDGSYAPYKPSELLTVRILSIYGACISLWPQGTVCYGSYVPYDPYES